MPYSYTNRHGKIHFFKAVKTKKGGVRYSVTRSANFDNLIEKIPDGFEIAELPEEARVVIRKIVPVNTTNEEKDILHQAIEKYSAIKDFFIHTERDALTVFYSQFNHAGGQEENLSAEQAIENYGEAVNTWKRYFDALRFVLIDEEKRLFQAERRVYLGFYNNEYCKIGNADNLKALAQQFGQHLGRDSFFGIVPEGFEE